MNMQFINPRNYNNSFYNKQNSRPMMTLMNINMNRPVQQYQPAPNNEVVVPKNDSKKIKWGAPTWFFFHTLAHKVKDEQFNNIKKELFYNIVSICKNLPCPKCTTHATEYINKIDINSIQTKDDLKNMLFTFHNDVNTRTGADQFPYDELDEKYSNAITVNVIQHFFFLFQDKSFNVTAIANNMHRDRIIFYLKDWITKNIQYFDA